MKSTVGPIVIWFLFAMVASSVVASNGSNVVVTTQNRIEDLTNAKIRKERTGATRRLRGVSSLHSRWLVPGLDASEDHSTSSPVNAPSSVPTALTAPPSYVPTSIPTQDYIIKVKTGNKRFASTTSNIYATICGDKGSTDEIHLNEYIDSKTAFERGNIDTVTLEDLASLGTLQNITIRSDGSGFGSDWYLDWISVNGKQFVFDQWIDNESVSVEFFIVPPTSAPAVSTGGTNSSGGTITTHTGGTNNSGGGTNNSGEYDGVYIIIAFVVIFFIAAYFRWDCSGCNGCDGCSGFECP